jgi:hypothetical protein
MTAIHADLRAIIEAVEILSPSMYVLRGEPREIPAARDARLVSALTEDLYQRLYLRPSSWQAAPPPNDLARRDFLAAISAANSGRGTWEPSWTIVRLDPDGRIVVAKDGVTFWVAPEGVRVGDGEPRPGSACRVWVGKELRNLVPGFYIALGDSVGDADDRGDGFEPLVRYYWHLTLDGAAPFVQAATAVLNAAGLPFRIKLLREPIAYRRADAGVLYLRCRYHERVGDAIARIHAAVSSGLRPDVPLFTKPLAPGLAVAEDAGGNLSFGEHRCGLAAQALWESFLQGDADPASRAGTMGAVFRQAGLDPTLPYLEPGSRDEYAFPALIA